MLREYRRDDRFSCSAPLQLNWEADDGSQGSAITECIEISRRGMKVVAPKRVPQSLRVQFTMAAARIRGSATVRSCRASGLKYVIGVEFSPDVRWDPDKTPIPGMIRKRRVTPPVPQSLAIPRAV